MIIRLICSSLWVLCCFVVWKNHYALRFFDADLSKLDLRTQPGLDEFTSLARVRGIHTGKARAVSE